MSEEEGNGYKLRIDFLPICLALLVASLAMGREYMLAILFMLGLIFIELAAIRRAIEAGNEARKAGQ